MGLLLTPDAGLLTLVALSTLISGLVLVLNWGRSLPVQLMALANLLASLTIIIGQIVNVTTTTAIMQYCYLEAFAINLLTTGMYGAVLCIYFEWYQIISARTLIDQHSARAQLVKVGYIVVVFVVPFVALMTPWAIQGFPVVGASSLFCDMGHGPSMLVGFVIRCAYVLIGTVLLVMTVMQFWSKLVVAFRQFARTPSSKGTTSGGSSLATSSHGADQLPHKKGMLSRPVDRAMAYLRTKRTLPAPDMAPSAPAASALPEEMQVDSLPPNLSPTSTVAPGDNEAELVAADLLLRTDAHSRTESVNSVKDTRSRSATAAAVTLLTSRAAAVSGAPHVATRSKAHGYQSALLVRLGVFCGSYAAVAIPVLIYQGVVNWSWLSDMSTQSSSDVFGGNTLLMSATPTVVAFYNPFTVPISLTWTVSYFARYRLLAPVSPQGTATVTVAGLFCAAVGILLVFGTGRSVRSRYHALFGWLIRPTRRVWARVKPHLPPWMRLGGRHAVAAGATGTRGGFTDTTGIASTNLDVSGRMSTMNGAASPLMSPLLATGTAPSPLGASLNLSRSVTAGRPVTTGGRARSQTAGSSPLALSKASHVKSVYDEIAEFEAEEACELEKANATAPEATAEETAAASESQAGPDGESPAGPRVALTDDNLD